LLLGGAVAIGLVRFSGWIGATAATWQFALGIGMACAVTALPILILFMEKLEILRQPIGQRILRYASMDDVAIWGVLALILMDWHRLGKQLTFLIGFAIAAWCFRKIALRLPERDRWYVGLIWLVLCGLGADWSGLHFMVGAFLSGAIMDASWFDQKQMDALRRNVLLIVMPVFFLSTGLRTTWTMGGTAVFLVAGILLVASIGGKLLGTRMAGAILHWQPGESSFIGWLLQTKALIMIIFVNVLLDKGIITSTTFTALLLMAVGSTMLTIPLATPKLQRLREIKFKTA
jgi:Kef-type K+ transport system membrane component KefB